MRGENRQTLPLDLNALTQQLAHCGQSHLLRYWDSLASAEQSALMGDLSRLDFGAIPELAQLARRGDSAPHQTSAFEAPPVIRGSRELRDARATGDSLLRAGAVAAFTVAGGQGTRLGFDGPKGAFPISPIRKKSLFQLFAEALVATGRKFGRPIRWYIMTSPANDSATKAFLNEHRFFGLESSQVMFFEQGVMPAFDRDGRILLEARHRVALSPDGHGGSLLAMARQCVLADMADRGIEYISYFQVDNPLVHCVDPVFIGLHQMHRSEMSSKVVAKADDLERVGNFVLTAGRLTVIEYSDFPEGLARSRNPDGTRRFDAGNIAIHVLSRGFVERLTADQTAFGLPWHRAEKKIPYVDLETGEQVEPSKPNGVKLESFIFDALPLAKNPILYETARAEEFSPVKNATGVDSVETAQRDMIRRAAEWLESKGVAIPRGAHGEPATVIEISPLAAVEAADLDASRVTQPVRSGWELYIG